MATIHPPKMSILNFLRLRLRRSQNAFGTLRTDRITFRMTHSLLPTRTTEFTLLMLGDEDAPTYYMGRTPGMPKSKRVEIPLAEARSLFARVSRIKGSFVPAYSMGADGATCELEVGRGFNSTSFRWWKSGQRGADRSLSEVADDFVRMAEKYGVVPEGRFKTSDWN